MVANAAQRIDLRGNIKKNFFSETIRAKKLILCINVNGINFYVNCVIVPIGYDLYLLWQLKVAIDL